MFIFLVPVDNNQNISRDTYDNLMKNSEGYMTTFLNMLFDCDGMQFFDTSTTSRSSRYENLADFVERYNDEDFDGGWWSFLVDISENELINFIEDRMNQHSHLREVFEKQVNANKVAKKKKEEEERNKIKSLTDKAYYIKSQLESLKMYGFACEVKSTISDGVYVVITLNRKYFCNVKPSLTDGQDFADNDLSRFSCYTFGGTCEELVKMIADIVSR